MLLAAALFLLQTAPAANACKAIDAGLPASLSGWTAPGEDFAPGKAATFDTSDPDRLSGLPAGAKPGRAVMVAFRVASAGTYGVALDQPGWIDLLPGISGGTPLASSAHGHGPECSSIRKIVRFRLDPGLYRIYVTGLGGARVKLMLVADE